MVDYEEDDEDFGAMLDAFEQEQSDGSAAPRSAKDPKNGEKVSGTILSIGLDYAFVDLGSKSEGVVQCVELLDDDGDLTVDVGDTISGVVQGRDESGSLILKVRPGRGETQRAEVRAAFEQKIPIEGAVKDVNKGGFDIDIAGMRAFCPVSQISDRYVEEPQEFVGRRLEFRIQRYEEKGRHTNIVVSRRALLEEENARLAEETRKKLDIGAVLDGVVRSVTNFGAFIDLGGIEGLLHVSEMSHQRIDDPRQMVSEGQSLEVQVLRIEPGKKEGQQRISLSTKALQKDPWHDVATRFPVGTELEGMVRRLEKFGAFVELVPGVDGLVHVSQLGRAERVNHAREVVELGQMIKVRVLDVDETKRRISLMAVTEPKPEDDRSQFEGYLGESQPSRESGGFGSGGFSSLGAALEKSRSQD